MPAQYATATEARAEVAAAYFPAATADALIDRALQDNAALIDGYLAARYTLPLSSWPGALRRCNAILAAYDMAHARGFDAGGVGSWIRQQRDWWVKWLEQVRDGRLSPPGIVDATPGEDAGPEALSDEPRGW